MLLYCYLVLTLESLVAIYTVWCFRSGINSNHFLRTPPHASSQVFSGLLSRIQLSHLATRSRRRTPRGVLFRLALAFVDVVDVVDIPVLICPRVECECRKYV